MQKYLNLLVSAFILFSVVSCASSRSNIKLSSVKDGQGVFYGKIKVVMDQVDVTDQCYIGTKDSDDKRVYYTLDKTGLFTGISKTGENWLGELRCRKGMSHYSFIMQSKDHRFNNFGKNKQTYFGDMTFTWETKHDVTSKGLILLGGFGGAMAANTPQDLKYLQVQVFDNFESTTKLFRGALGEKDVLRGKISLINVPRIRSVAGQK